MHRRLSARTALPRFISCGVLRDGWAARSASVGRGAARAAVYFSPLSIKLRGGSAKRIRDSTHGMQQQQQRAVDESLCRSK
jgi:hypothetical protein